MEEDSMTKMLENVNLQLSEISMLESMFPETSEFLIDDELVKSMKNFADGSTNIIPPGLDYTIYLNNNKGKISVHVSLTFNYPFDPPDIYVRSNELSRENQTKLNSHLTTFSDTIESGDLVVGSVISWLQDNAEDYLTDVTKPIDRTSLQDSSFSRAWVYSHHIYSKVKRKDIKDLATEFNLTGFCLPGKPGIMCVEGSSSNVKDWWHTVRSWKWQKIMLTRLEEKNVVDGKVLNRFEDFQELGSHSNIRIKTSGYHVDMGDLLQYLINHDSGYMFEEFFGVAGKVN